MHWRYIPLQVPVPRQTPAASAVSVPYPIIQGHLKQLEIQIPAGHHGQTGLRVLYQGVQIYPWSITASWLIEDNRLRTVEWDDEIMATGLTVQAYNTDLVPHSFYLLAEIWPAVTAAPAAVGTRATARGRAGIVTRIGRLRSARAGG